MDYWPAPFQKGHVNKCLPLNCWQKMALSDISLLLDRPWKGITPRRAPPRSLLLQPWPMWMPCPGWDILGLRVGEFSTELAIQRVIPRCIFTAGTAMSRGQAAYAGCIMNERAPSPPSRELPRHSNPTSWLNTTAARPAPTLHVGCVTLTKKKAFCIVSARLTFRVFTFQSALSRRAWTPRREQVQRRSALAQTFAKITPKWQINTSCFYRCKINRSNADPGRGGEAGPRCVWRIPLHHLHLQTLCNLNLFVAFMLYWPPKVKERDLDLKHKSSLQALELSLPLNATDQCPFLLKIKPFWTLKAFHCWAMSKCHMGKWAEKKPIFPLVLALEVLKFSPTQSI